MEHETCQKCEYKFNIALLKNRIVICEEASLHKNTELETACKTSAFLIANSSCIIVMLERWTHRLPSDTACFSN
jgi:hypothetical protein